MEGYFKYKDGFIGPEDVIPESWPFDQFSRNDIHRAYSWPCGHGTEENEANIFARILLLKQRSIQHNKTLTSGSLSVFLKTMMKEKDLCYYIDYYEQRLVKIYQQMNKL